MKKKDITPALADRIGQWKTARPSPLDALAIEDPYVAVAELLSMLRTYRDITERLLTCLQRLTAKDERVRDEFRHILAELLDRCGK